MSRTNLSQVAFCLLTFQCQQSLFHPQLKLPFRTLSLMVITCTFKSVTCQSSVNGMAVLACQDDSWVVNCTFKSEIPKWICIGLSLCSLFTGLEMFLCAVGRGLRSMKPLRETEVDSWCSVKWALVWASFKYETRQIILNAEKSTGGETACFMDIRLNITWLRLSLAFFPPSPSLSEMRKNSTRKWWADAKRFT